MADQQDKKIIEQVNLYLDNELSRGAEKQLLSEIKDNPGYSEILESERHFKAYLRDNISRRTVSPDLVSKIKDKIRSRPSSRH